MNKKAKKELGATTLDSVKTEMAPGIENNGRTNTAAKNIGWARTQRLVAGPHEFCWGPPAGVRIEGGSYGFQIGGSSTDVFMLIMNENGMKRLLSDKFTIGGEAAAAAGPVGRNTSANTDVLFTRRNLVLVPVPGIICRVVPGRRNDAA